MAVSLDGPPPLPPPGGGPGTPTFASAIPQDQVQPSMGPSAGLAQTGNAAMRLAMEIDASMKMLAQMVPQLGPWAEQSTVQLRMQLGQALMGGNIPTSPEPPGNDVFPGGLGNL